MRKVLFITNRKDDLRELYYKTRDVWVVSGISDPANSVNLIASGGYDLIFLDLAMTGAYGPDILVRITSLQGHPPVFILSREYSSCFLKFAQNYGVVEYFLMPYSINRIIETVGRYFEASGSFRSSSSNYGSAESAPGAEIAADTCGTGEPDPCPAATRLVSELLGKSPQMERVRRAILDFRQLREPVLITGETGSGKDLVAKLIHRNSPVASGPYATFNVSCIPSNLAESILFGTERGGYTEARDAPGLFERANRGTLFLDEIGELDRFIQPKFLRVLEDKEVLRVGAERNRKVDFRLLCATNCRMVDEVSSGRFRADLFHRIDVLRIQVPPLREHIEDIPILAASFLPRFKKTLSVGALDKLQRHDWPGNVRDLFNCLARATGSTPGDVIQPGHILF